MNLSLPADAGYQLASSTTQAIFAFAPPAIIVMGILLAFFILELVVDSFHTTSTHSTERAQ